MHFIVMPNHMSFSGYSILLVFKGDLKHLIKTIFKRFLFFSPSLAPLSLRLCLGFPIDLYLFTRFNIGLARFYSALFLEFTSNLQ